VEELSDIYPKSNPRLLDLQRWLLTVIVKADGGLNEKEEEGLSLTHCPRRRPDIRGLFTCSGTRQWSSKRVEMEGITSGGEREGRK
jgi:hypothetical protein